MPKEENRCGRNATQITHASPGTASTNATKCVDEGNPLHGMLSSTFTFTRRLNLADAQYMCDYPWLHQNALRLAFEYKLTILFIRIIQYIRASLIGLGLQCEMMAIYYDVSISHSMKYTNNFIGKKSLLII